MVAFIVLFSVIAFYIVSAGVVFFLSTDLLRKQGRPPKYLWYSSLENLRGLWELMNDPKVPEDVAARARFYFRYLTWGFGFVVVLFLVLFVLTV